MTHHSADSVSAVGAAGIQARKPRSVSDWVNGTIFYGVLGIGIATPILSAVYAYVFR